MTATSATRRTARDVSLAVLLAGVATGCGPTPGDRSPASKVESLTVTVSPSPTAPALSSPKPPAKAADHQDHWPTADQMFPPDPWGIVDNPEAPAHGWEFTAGNSWHGRSSGHEVTVYAGAAGFEHPDTGAVMVRWRRPVAGSLSQTLTLPGSGPLMLVAANGDRLILWDADGYRHYLRLSRPRSTLTGPVGNQVAVPATSPSTASVCEPQPNPVVMIIVGPDTPRPRCAKVFADQSLRIVNGTDEHGAPGQPVTVRFPTLPTTTLEIGAARTFRHAFAHLAPGVHPLRFSVFSGGGMEVLVR